MDNIYIYIYYYYLVTVNRRHSLILRFYYFNQYTTDRLPILIFSLCSELKIKAKESC